MEKRTKRFTKTPALDSHPAGESHIHTASSFFRKEREQKPVLSSKKHPLGVPAIKQVPQGFLITTNS